MVGAILGLRVWHMTALSGVGRQDCPRKRRPVRIRQSKVNRPNVAPMGVTSPRLQSWVVDITNNVHELPLKVIEELFPIPPSSPLWEYIQWYNAKYNKFIVFKIEVKE